MERRVAVRAIIADEDGRLLCVRLKDYNGTGSGGGDFWCTIGGGIDSGEALVTALMREVIEETGIVPVIGNLLYVQQFVHNNKEHLELFFHVTNYKDFINIDLAKTTHGLEEIERIEFIDATTENVLPKFLTEMTFIDLDHTHTKFFNYL